MKTAMWLTISLFLAGAAFAGEPPVPDSDLPESLLHEPMPDEPDAVHVYVTEDGIIHLGGEKYAALDSSPRDETTRELLNLKSALYILAEGRREEAHEAKPCARAFVVHTHARAPFRAVVGLSYMGHDQVVRIYRWYWAVRPVEGDGVSVLPVLSPKDRGRAPGPFAFPRPLPFHVSLERAAGALETQVSVNGRNLGRGAEGLELLDEAVAGIRRSPEHAALIATAALKVRHFRAAPPEPEVGDARVAEVVRVLTRLRNAGFASVGLRVFGQDPRDRDRSCAFYRWPEEAVIAAARKKAEAALRERFRSMCADLPAGVAILDTDRGLSAGFREAVESEARWSEVGDSLQSLFLRETSGRDVFRRGLRPGGLTRASVEEFLHERKARYFLLPALTRAWLEAGGEGNLRRALALCGLSTLEHPRYTAKWWGRELLGLRVLCRLACDHGDDEARAALLDRLGTYEDLGLLEGSPHAAEIRSIAERLKSHK